MKIALQLLSSFALRTVSMAAATIGWAGRMAGPVLLGLNASTAIVTAAVCYLPTGGRLTAIDDSTGQRKVVSGWKLPASGYIAVSPIDGDIYTGDQEDRGVYRIDHLNGTTTMVSGPGVGSGPAFSRWMWGLALEADGKVVIGDGDSTGGLHAVVRVDRMTGERTIASAGANSGTPVGTGAGFQTPSAIAVEASGDLLVTDFTANAVIRVARGTGNRTVISGAPLDANVGTGPNLNGPMGIALDTDGAVIVACSGSTGYYNDWAPSLIRIDPVTGNRLLLSSPATEASAIYGINIAGDGGVLIAFAVSGGGALQSVDHLTGVTTPLSGLVSPESIDWLRALHNPPQPVFTRGSGPTFVQPIATAIGFDGAVLVSDVTVRSIFHVDPVSGVRSILPNSRKGEGFDLCATKGITVDGQGRLVVVDRGNSEPVLLQIDRSTGSRTVLSAGTNTTVTRGSGANFLTPNGVAAEASGSLIVVDSGGGNPRVLRVNSATGDRSVVSSSMTGAGPNLSTPYAVAVEASGSIVLTDQGLHAIVRIDPVTGGRTILSNASTGTGPNFAMATGGGIVVLADGALVIADGAVVLRVDATSGNRTILSGPASGTGPALSGATGIAITGSGDLVVYDRTLKTLVRIVVATGDRAVVSNATTGAGPLPDVNGQTCEFLAVDASSGDGSGPAIVTQPRSRAVGIDSGVTFTVAAIGSRLTYQWRKNGIDLIDDARVTGATTATLSLAAVALADAGTYSVRVTNDVDNQVSDDAALAVIDIRGAHAVMGSGYVAGSTVSVTNRVSYAGTLSNLGWSVLLPEGWSYRADAGAAANVSPKGGDTGVVEWAWADLPASPFSFTYTLNVPTEATGSKTITALLLARGGREYTAAVRPDPLAIEQVTFHTGDINRDGRFALSELLRTIELYNTRNGTIRTGGYVVNASNPEDGFGTDPARGPSAVVTLARYHSADTDHDARLGLTELLRVIELYNYRQGTVRTGQYHVQAGTEDCFDPGP